VIGCIVKLLSDRGCSLGEEANVLDIHANLECKLAPDCVHVDQELALLSVRTPIR